MTPKILFTALGWLALLCMPKMLFAQQATAPEMDTIPLRVTPRFCKSPRFEQWIFERPGGLSQLIPLPPVTAHIAPSEKAPKLKGNLLYEYLYQSQVDTPFTLANFQQHYLQSNLYVTAFQKYPLQIMLSGRFSNSPYFRNYLDVNILFNQTDYKEQLRKRLQQLQAQAGGHLRTQYQQLYNKVLATSEQATQLQDWLQQDYQLQRLTECREQLGRLAQQKAADAVNKNHDGSIAAADAHDSTAAMAFLAEYESKKQLKDSLLYQADSLKTAYFSQKEKAREVIQNQTTAFNKTRSLAELERQLKAQGISKDSLPKHYRFLFALKRFNVGRSLVNYSPLTVNNIVLTGINVEFNPGFYYAFAAGKVNYQFRDFVLQNRRDNRQQLTLLRFGYGDIARNFIAATAYTGRKDQFNLPGNAGNSSQVFGFSLAASLQLSQHHGFNAEIAKSGTRHVFENGINTYTPKPRLRLADRHSLAWLLQWNRYLPATRTRLNAFAQQMGADFQSFSLFPSGANRLWWRMSMQQALLKNRLQVNAAISKNEFSNPFILQRYKSNAVFGSISATLRMKRWPIISAGYLPTSQYSIVNDQLSESRFYSLYGSASHFYRVKGLYASTVLLASRYFNKGSDSGFVYYNATNLLLTHHFMGKHCRWNSSVLWSTSTAYSLLTLDQGLQYQLHRRLSMGGGLKYNRLADVVTRLGYYLNMNLQIPGIGDFSLSGEHGFLPGINNALLRNDMGRITYLKNF
jgi:hypothetical protein